MHRLLLLAQDSKYTLRFLRKNPGFTAVAILVLALGIGSNLAVFSLIDSLFLKSLPVEKPGELSQIAAVDREGRAGAMPSTLVELLRGEMVFRGVCGYFTSRVPMDLNGTIRSATTLSMTGDCFAGLGLRARIGRPFTVEDDRRGAAGVALLTDSFWRNSFGAAADAVGRKVLVKGAPFTIIGVADPQFTGFRLGSIPDVIIPLQQTPLDFVPLPNRPVFFFVNAIARRAAGVSERQAQARMSVLEKGLLEQSVPFRYNEGERREYLARKILVSPADPGANSHLRSRFGKPLYTILGICACVLLIACVNLTSLLLARGLGRAKEIAVRLALGANRTAVVRLFVLQSFALVLAGGLLGMLFAQWTRRWLVLEAGDLFSVSPDFAVDSHTAGFLAGLMAAAMAALAAAPAWQGARFHRSAALNESGRGVVGSSTRNQKVLLAFQIALTLALVSGSGLFTGSMKHLDEMNLGMRTAGVSEAMLAPLAGGFTGASAGPYYRELLQQVEARPEVASAGLSDFAPFWYATRQDPVAVENSPQGSDLRAQAVAVTEGVFETLGVPLLAGEGFRRNDPEAGEPVAMVSESLARRFGGNRVIGQRISVGELAAYQRMKVTGIVGDVQLSLENPDETHPLTVYVNLWQHPERQRYATLLTRPAGRAPVQPAVLRGIVQSRGREYVQQYVTVDEAKDQALIENRLLAWLSAAFGVLALALAATGLFGLLSYHVAGRTNEIGLRMALGAERRGIESLVLRQLLPVLAAGVTGGLGLTLLIGKVMSGLVFGVSVYDPRLLGASVGVLAATAVLAAWIPARRASSVDPLTALRHE